MGMRKGAGAGPAGSAARASRAAGARRERKPVNRWGAAAEVRFLNSLAASCNVERSAAEAGFSKVTVYKRRRLDPAFAASWQAALEQGYARLEMMLVQRSNEVLEGLAGDEDLPFPAMTVADAIKILQLHRAAATGGIRSRRWRGRPRSLDEVRASILRKLDAIETARRAGKLP